VEILEGLVRGKRVRWPPRIPVGVNISPEELIKFFQLEKEGLEFILKCFIAVTNGESLRRFESPVDAVDAYVQGAGIPEPSKHMRLLLYDVVLRALAPL
jgi:hypothetical protein